MKTTEDPTKTPTTDPVIAYRVGELEKTTKEYFTRFETKIDRIAESFATKAEFEAFKIESKAELVASKLELEAKVAEVKKPVYGAITLILTGFVVALIGIVFAKL